MAFGNLQYFLSFLAGVLSTLSPCVLPIIPILLASAVHVHKYAPVAMAVGLSLSYAVFGTLIAWAGFELNFDVQGLRTAGGFLLAMLGFLIMSDSLQRCFASLTSGVGSAGNNLISRIKLDGLLGQFVVGLVLGSVWTPCVGPTLGVAVVLASQGSNLMQVALTMGLFALGAALPMVVLAFLGRSAMQRVKDKIVHAGKYARWTFGLVLIAEAILIVSGADKALESWLIDASPTWLIDLSTKL